MIRIPAARGSALRWGLVPVLLLGLFLLAPLGAIVWRGLAPDGQPSLAAAREVATSGYYWQRLAFTAGQAAASTAVAVLLGLPCAWLFSQVRFPGQRLLRALVMVPFVLPTLVVALAFERLIGTSGWLARAATFAGLPPAAATGTLRAILAANVFYNLSVVIRLVGAAWANLDPRTAEAATILGAGRLRRFTAVTLPALMPAILAASALVFMFCFTAFGTVLLLGGGDPDLDTLEVVVYRLTTRLVDLPPASVVALVQIATTLLVLLVYAQLQRRAARTVNRQPAQPRRLRDLSWGGRLLVVSLVVLLAMAVLTPMAALVHGALTVGNGGSGNGANFARLFGDTDRTSYISPLTAARWSLTFALGSTLVATVIGLAAGMAVARGRGTLAVLADAVLMLPLAVPAVTLAFGYFVTFNREPFDLRGSPWLVLIAHALLGYPFVMRAVLASARGLDPALVEAARVLGASRRRAWLRIVAPLISRGALVGAGFAFVISIGEFGATLLLQRAEFATIPIAIFESLARPGAADLGVALALATILMAVSAAVFLLIERVRYREAGWF